MAPHDPLSERTLADPGPGWAALLRDEPVHYYDRFDPPFYTLSRHADVTAALRDVGTWSSEFGQGPRFSVQGGMLSDPPEHTRYRALVQMAFTRTSLADWQRNVIRPVLHGLLDGIVGRGCADLTRDYAFRFPARIIARLFGVPDAHLETFHRLSVELQCVLFDYERGLRASRRLSGWGCRWS